jgi:hypothetical protein
VKSITELNCIIREQGLLKKSLTPRKVFFDEAEVDMRLARRNENVAQANIDHIKLLRTQRKDKEIHQEVFHDTEKKKGIYRG